MDIDSTALLINAAMYDNNKIAQEILFATHTRQINHEPVHANTSNFGKTPEGELAIAGWTSSESLTDVPLGRQPAIAIA